MAKCDLCHVRVEHGLLPACVHTCTTGALQYGATDELAAAKSGQAATTIIKAAGIME
jgi:Fe-S-cluster-containing dehydrogenase component